jgi:hypothetical protein
MPTGDFELMRGFSACVIVVSPCGPFPDISEVQNRHGGYLLVRDRLPEIDTKALLALVEECQQAKREAYELSAYDKPYAESVDLRGKGNPNQPFYRNLPKYRRP